MIQVSIHEAKTQLSKLIQKTLNGEDVIILKRAQPIIRLQVIKPQDPTKRIGGLKGSFYKMSDKFNDPLLNDSLAETFYASSPSSPRSMKNNRFQKNPQKNSRKKRPPAKARSRTKAGDLS